MTASLLAGVASVGLIAAGLSAALVLLLFPLMQRYALARPNARSSHRVPTPQGGGIAVLAAMLVTACAGISVLAPGAISAFIPVAMAAVVLAVIGAFDDIRPLPVLPRLLFQFGAVALGVAAAGEIRLFPALLPAPVEFALVVLAGVWFVNLVNFMDGLDWITVAEVAPVTAALALFALLGALPGDAGLVAIGLCGAMLGFAPFNRPVARLFLGDVGSLPIGLILGFLLYRLAGEGHLTAALLLPLYYLADATLTLLMRLRRGEKVWQAHRSHFYQRATDNGFTVMEVVGTVFALNLVLAGLATSAVLAEGVLVPCGLLMAGIIAVAIVLARFARPRPAVAAGRS
ncbi:MULTISPECIES: glycosyl transferase [unclassified Chelatococcus]|uniref:glycosyl transferase n=1 Tax=unclassified Chelatococcus TaxID=2638111 RepID=UPI001BD0FB57|nr:MULTISPECIES: glycosyl transferase [unclassified Chelatococcus]CAH1659059.1 UDP-N-acetylmuramyl pentapeptide phosphotransferase/UDP-N-acetylglucosamine-1-phosphate transferase [Hyphomicrobiales bacterium]MBS7740887.1 glycosyl transferase [Chelatococcus sp. HY11]MBX3546822.1 glycosyl transferase [Chelatococcus sp.]MCO5077705.1 glycosyl transferase [Chelatococcus sp.]CAH1683940.1 UDP-N-acetylmuramyl pentapeptide phosphotransferase/UDP-N-acetylglucosamine-1-phosphate transferase [Hyphomicrobia